MAGWLGWLGGLFLPVTLPPHFVRGEVTRESEGFAEQMLTRLKPCPDSLFACSNYRARVIGGSIQQSWTPGMGGTAAGLALIYAFRNFYQILGPHCLINSRTMLFN